MRKLYIEIKWAVIFSIALLSWMLLEKTLAWHEKGGEGFWWLTLVFTPIAVLMYLLALREKRRRVYGEKISWSQAFRSGVILSVFIALLSPLVQYITYTFITPYYFNTVQEYSVTNNFMTVTKANDYLSINNYIWQASFGAFGLGILTSAITAFFVQKK